MRATRSLLAPLVVVLALLLGACGGDQGSDVDPDQVDAVDAPQLGACRVLKPVDVTVATNATRAVACTERHTAETYAVGDLPAELHDLAWSSPTLRIWAYQTCSAKLGEFLGADESLVMRTVVSWAWFRPSEKAWAEGARWYRCDAVGGGEQSRSYVALPTTARGLMDARPEKRDRWMVCAIGASVNDAPKLPCTRKHDWRAVTTIKLGTPDAAYPGDDAVAAKSRDFCASSVGAWLRYPDDYDYGYTWFGPTEWAAGNRRSVCWAKITQ